MKTLQGIEQIHDECYQENTGQSGTMKVPCEVYSRVVGYLRPVQNWNNGKQQEFLERKTFRLKEEYGDQTT